MKKNQIKLLFSAVALGMLSMVSPLSAQAGKVSVGKPKFDELQSPEVGGNTGSKSFKPKDWFEAEVEFKVEMPNDYKEKFVDSVTVKWYVAAKNPAGRGHILIEKEVKHINVPVGEEMFTSVYLSPTSLLRLDSKVEFIGGEIQVNGQPAVKRSGFFTSKGSKGSKKKAPWWESESLSKYNKVPLLNKNETPFKFLWWDRYAELKNEQR